MDTFTMTVFEDATQMMGINIIHDKKCSTISISQSPYVLSLLNKCDMADYNPVYIPDIGNELATEPEGSAPLSKEDAIEYQSIMGPRICLCQSTRVGIYFAVSQAARFMSEPISVYMRAVKRILRYLRGTPDLHTNCSCNSSFKLVGFCDASYGT
ncbi:unnamed protein product, partial [Ascophyllum nodosum]